MHTAANAPSGAGPSGTRALLIASPQPPGGGGVVSGGAVVGGGGTVRGELVAHARTKVEAQLHEEGLENRWYTAKVLGVPADGVVKVRFDELLAEEGAGVRGGGPWR